MLSTKSKILSTFSPLGKLAGFRNISDVRASNPLCWAAASGGICPLKLGRWFAPAIASFTAGLRCCNSPSSGVKKGMAFLILAMLLTRGKCSRPSCPSRSIAAAWSFAFSPWFVSLKTQPCATPPASPLLGPVWPSPLPRPRFLRLCKHMWLRHVWQRTLLLSFTEFTGDSPVVFTKWRAATRTVRRSFWGGFGSMLHAEVFVYSERLKQFENF